MERVNAVCMDGNDFSWSMPVWVDQVVSWTCCVDLALATTLQRNTKLLQAFSTRSDLC